MLKIISILEKLKIPNAHDVMFQIGSGKLNDFLKLYNNFENMTGGVKEKK